MILPMAFGTIAGVALYATNMYPDLSAFKRFGIFAATIGLSTKDRKSTSRT